MISSVDIEGTLRMVQSYLSQSGLFAAQQIGEPKSPPAVGLAAAVFMADAGVAEVVLDSTIERHAVTIRLYRNMLAEPLEDAEIEMANAASRILTDMYGDYDLGATVRAIDVAGIYGGGVHARWGYVEVSGVMFRIVDISLPLIIDGAAAQFTQ